jgi:cysteine desulfurase
MIYLDNSATTRPSDEVIALTAHMMAEEYGNPSSQHFWGAEAYNSIQKARSQAAMLLGSSPSSIVFTAGGTQSNNLAILGAARHGSSRRHIVTTAIEHDSVLAPIKALERQGFEVSYIYPSLLGTINAFDVIEAIRPDTLLVSVMHVNNETGEILPIQQIAQDVKSRDSQILVHTDCVQSLGKIPISMNDVKADLLSASAHKIHGPKGVGLLYMRDPSLIDRLSFGGKQELGLWPGTENTQGICAFGLACEMASLHMKENLDHAKGLVSLLKTSLENDFPEASINSPEGSSPYLLNFSLKGCKATELIGYLSRHDIYISSSAACSMGQASHVLKSMALDEEALESSVRIGFSNYSTEVEVISLLNAIRDFLNMQSSR